MDETTMSYGNDKFNVEIRIRNLEPWTAYGLFKAVAEMTGDEVLEFTIIRLPKTVEEPNDE